MTAYYNEIDPFKAEILREAIQAGAIAPGDVDERSIVNVEPGDLVGYAQCHFFAGGGFWSLALRQAGWLDDREVWTGSCPCPSFSAAGKGKGFDDPRHLWPDWIRLIRQLRPSTIFGEQVSAAIGHGWLDLVQTDLETQDYAVGKAVFGAAIIGAPHIRQRLFFVGEKQPGSVKFLGDAAQRGFRIAGSAPGRGGHIDRADQPLRMGDSGRTGLPDRQSEELRGAWRGQERRATAESSEVAGGLAESLHAQRWPVGVNRGDGRDGPDAGRQETHSLAGTCGEVFRSPPVWPTPLNGFWRDADWIGCRDGKWRPVEPGTFPLAHGSTARVGRLRLYGDAICVPAARAFIESYLETEQ